MKGYFNQITFQISERSGAVCLDVINQTWSPMFDLFNIFEVFLPQLLLYPNPKDPLNPEAAHYFLQNEKHFKTKAQEYVKKYASASKNNENNSQNNNLHEEKKHLKHSQSNEEKKEQTENNLDQALDDNNIDQIVEDEEKLSSLSEVSELSKTSNISLIEDK